MVSFNRKKELLREVSELTKKSGISPSKEEDGFLEEVGIDLEEVAGLVMRNKKFISMMETSLTEWLRCYMEDLVDNFSPPGAEEEEVSEEQEMVPLSLLQEVNVRNQQEVDRHIRSAIGLVWWGVAGWLGFLLSVTKILGAW